MPPKESKSSVEHPEGFAGRVRRLGLALFHEMAPKILFFFVAFMILFLLFKLFVAQYSVTYGAFARAAVAALILGKVIPLLEWAQSGYRFERQRRIVVIAGKTLAYGLVVILLGTGERLFEAYRKAGSVRGAFETLKAQANVNHFVGLVLLISLVVGAYLTTQEIDRVLGRGTLLRVLFQRPQEPGSNTATGRGA
jgi:hypothetical protein